MRGAWEVVSFPFILVVRFREVDGVRERMRREEPCRRVFVPRPMRFGFLHGSCGLFVVVVVGVVGVVVNVVIFVIVFFRRKNCCVKKKKFVLLSIIFLSIFLLVFFLLVSSPYSPSLPGSPLSVANE